METQSAAHKTNTAQGDFYLPLTRAKAHIKQAFLGGAVMTSKDGNRVGRKFKVYFLEEEEKAITTSNNI